MGTCMYLPLGIMMSGLECQGSSPETGMANFCAALKAEPTGSTQAGPSRPRNSLATDRTFTMTSWMQVAGFESVARTRHILPPSLSCTAATHSSPHSP